MFYPFPPFIPSHGFVMISRIKGKYRQLEAKAKFPYIQK